MRLQIGCASVLAAISLYAAPQSGSQFDGIWVGTETTELRAPFPPSRTGEKTSNKRPAKIIIAQQGTLLAIAQGTCPGRYSDVRRSNNALEFRAGNCDLQVHLSQDGKTLLEEGSATDRFQVTNGNVHYSKQFPAHVTGTFARQNR